MTDRSAHEGEQRTKAAYTAPTITVVREEDLLRTFQVTSAAGTWWVVVGGSA